MRLHGRHDTREPFWALLTGVAALAVVIVLLNACGPSIPSNARTPIFDELIVPGKRIGPVSLGMNERDLYAAMGEPRSTERSKRSNGTYTIYTYPDLSAWVIRDRINQVNAETTRYKTAQGVGLGDSELAVRAKIGIPDRVHEEGRRQGVGYCYRAGLHFEFREGVATQVYVFAPGC